MRGQWVRENEERKAKEKGYFPYVGKRGRKRGREGGEEEEEGKEEGERLVCGGGGGPPLI